MSKDFSGLLGGALANKQLNDSSVRDRIVIREEFKNLIPQLKSDELEQLEENILKEGIRDPLILWPVGEEFILIDGHNRHSVCEKHRLDFPFKIIDFKDDEEARDWMIRNQLGRRNLSPEQQSYLRGLRYKNEKSQGKRSDLTSGQNDQKLNTESTAEVLAKEYNVSPKTIVRDSEYAKGLDVIGEKNPELKKKILKGESSIKKGKIQSLAKNPEAIESIISEATNNKEEHKRKPSAEEISKIAFEYILSETAMPEEVYFRLGKNIENINPLEFFVVWDNTRKGKQPEA